MTVCIAMNCFDSEEKSLLFACDSMVSTTDMSSDLMAFKSKAIGTHWLAMYAGNDISCVTPILRDVDKYLTMHHDNLDNVQQAFVKAIQGQLRAKANNEVLLPLGYELEEFKQTGLQRLGSETFSRLLYEIQSLRIDVEFLVGGYEDNQPYIFTVSPPGRVADYSVMGFWAIGSGQTNALGSIFNAGGIARFHDLPTNLYRLCEAKFNAETAVGVGRKTFVCILKPDTSRFTLPHTSIDDLRPSWEKTRALKIPKDAWQTAKDLIKEVIPDVQPEASESQGQLSSGSQPSTDQQ